MCVQNVYICDAREEIFFSTLLHALLRNGEKKTTTKAEKRSILNKHILFIVVAAFATRVKFI